jgi:TonB family protein
MFVETAAAPVGGYQKFFEALSKELKYPAGLTTAGKCFVEFYIDTTGQTTDYKILRSFDSAVDQEVLRAMTALHYPWTPARLRDKPIRFRFVMPVAFDPIKK